MERLTEFAKSENWSSFETLLRIRDVPQHGKEHRYEGDALAYFYPIHCSKDDVIRSIQSRSRK